MPDQSLSGKPFRNILFLRICLAIAHVGFAMLICAMWVGTFCMVFGGHEHLSLTKWHVETTVVAFHVPVGFLN